MKKSTLLLFLIVLLFGFGGYFFFSGEESSKSVPVDSNKNLVHNQKVTKKAQTKTTLDTKSGSNKKFAQSDFTTSNNSNIKISTGFKKIPLRDRIDLAMEQEFQMTHDPATNTIPKGRLWKVYKELKEIENYQNKANAAISGINWIELGPTNQGGRTRAILVDPNDASGQTVFAAGVSGGIWKTTNINDASPTWTPVDEFMANIGVTCLVADPSNPQIMYAGTGEGYFNIDAGQGDGIFKSTDGGDTWSQLANTSTGVSSHFYYVQNIVVNSSGDIFAATRSKFLNRGGIQKSTDGGASWNVVLDNNTTGIASTNRAADIVMASNGDLYAAMGVFTSDGIYKSTTNGTSWTKVYDASSSGQQRIKLACAPSNSSIVYALVQDNASAIDDIIKTTNGGTNWNSTTGFSSINWLDQCSASGTDFSRGQAWYDMALAVDPNDPNIVWAGGVDMMRTTDGGANWTQITEWANCSGLEDIHADQHIVIYKPGNSDTILVGNDGGIYRCNNAAAGSPTFTYKGDNYRTLQLYACAIHPTAGSNHFLGGAQDNGSHKYSSSSLGTTVEVTGGDGAFCHIDQGDPTYQFTSYVFNYFRRSTNGGTSFSNVNVSSTGKFINPSDYDNDAQIMYSSYNSGQYLRWDNPTSGSTFNSVNPGFSGQVSAITCDPNTSHRVWFGTDDGNVYRVDNANTGTPTSTDLSPTGMGGSNAYVSCIEIENGDANHIVVTYSNYGVNSVWETTNGGSSWTNIEGNLPDMPIRWALFNPNDNTQLLLATELGVWSTDNINGGSTSWGQSSTGMANVRVDMLQYRSSDDMVIAATHGRGMYITDFFSPTSLPIEYLSLEGQKYEDYNLLKWETKKEVNNAGFEIQRSKNGVDFENIQFVSSNAKNFTGSKYEYKDFNVSNQTYYYRLKQVDLNGDENFSDIVEILPTTDKLFEILNIYPNPVTSDVLNLEIMLSKKNSEILISVLDITSKTVLSKEYIGNLGENKIVLDLNTLKSGAYFVKISINDKTEIQEFVKR